MFNMIVSVFQRPNFAGLDFIESEILIDNLDFEGKESEE